MNAATRIIVVLCAITCLVGCDFKEQADAQFGDQNFKSAIALIELHKIRFGTYPESLKDLQFMGAWDPLYINSVEYHRLNTGYELNLTRGWVSKPTTLAYPPAFWQGIGLARSNLKP